MTRVYAGTATCIIASFPEEKLKRILVGQRLDNDIWSFPGGSVEHDDQDARYSASREVHEEVAVKGKLIYHNVCYSVVGPGKYNEPYLTLFMLADATHILHRFLDEYGGTWCETEKWDRHSLSLNVKSTDKNTRVWSYMTYDEVCQLQPTWIPPAFLKSILDYLPNKSY